MPYAEGASMIAIGVAAHTGSRMAVAVDEAGREVAHWRGPHSVAGWRQVAAWASARGPARRWGIAGAWHDGRGLAQDRVAAGAEGDAVNPRWTATGRQRARRREEHDRRDAPAVALLVGRAGAALPRVAADDDTVARALPVAERAGLVAETTRRYKQIQQRLRRRDPQYAAHLPRLQTQAAWRALDGYAAAAAGTVPQHRAAAVRRLAHVAAWPARRPRPAPQRSARWRRHASRRWRRAAASAS